jgi:hypothetical protein
MKGVKFPFLNKKFEEGKLKIEKGKKPYLKQDGKISEFEIWIVDGEYIRKNICEDFVNIGQHYVFDFIPKNEFWIAKEADEGEEHFYVDHLLIENRLMACGVSYDESVTLASRVEKKERNKSLIFQKLKKGKPKKSVLIKEIHKKLIGKYENGVEAWIVNGELVRDVFDIYFTGGGHDKFYNFIPDKEIWIDDDIPEKEMKFILLHEMHERNLMKKGMHYRKAHFSATGVEDSARQNPKKWNSLFNVEIMQN